MGYFRKVSREAWSESWEMVLATPLKSVALGVLAIILSWIVASQTEGADAMSGQVKEALMYTASPLAAILLIVFLTHFFVLTPRRLMKQLWDENAALRTAALKISPFSVVCRSDVSGCSITHIGKPFHYFRAQVTTESSSDILGCYGVMFKITRNGVTLRDHHSDKLPFEFCADAECTNKTIRRGERYHLDVLVVDFSDSATQAVMYGAPNHRFFRPLTKDGKPVFSEHGTYDIEFLVSGKDETPAHCHAVFHWTGNYVTSQLSVQLP
jgi:hypothetical protein